MGQAIPRQHPAVVLRSHYRQLKVLLAITLVALVGLSLTVAILATDDEVSTGPTAAQSSFDRSAPIPSTPRPLPSQIAQVDQSVSPAPQIARPDESAVAAAIAPKPEVTRPDESAVAAAIAPKPEVARPDESKVAAAISRAQQVQADNGHDESDVAAAISGR